MNVAFYGRFSSEGQNEASIRQQFRIVREWCRVHGHKIVAVYYDRSYSGSSMNRPGVQRLLADAPQGRFDLVVSHKLNRFSRNLVDVILTIDTLQKLKHQVLYASATEMFDCTSMIGRVLLVLLAFFAEWYLVELSAETARGKHHRVSATRLQNNLPPFGYTYVNKNTPPVPNSKLNSKATDKRARTPSAAIHRLYRLRATNKRTGQMLARDQLNKDAAKELHSDADCARWLNAQGYKSREGNPFSPDSVGDLLTNPFFAGYVRETGYREGKTPGGQRRRTPRREGVRYKGQHTPLVPEWLFDLVQDARQLSAFNPTGRSERPDRVYLLGGLAVCSVCGHPMKRHAIYDRGGAPAYHCVSRKNNLPCDAPQSYVRESLLAPDLDALMRALVLPEVMERRIAEMVNVDEQVVNYRDEINAWRTRAEALDARLDMGRMKAATYKNEMRVALDKIAELEAKQASIGVVQAEVAFETYRGLVSVWESAGPEDRQGILHELLEPQGVRVHIASKRIHAFKPRTDFGFLFNASSGLEKIEGGWFRLKNETRPEHGAQGETVKAEVTGIVTTYTVSRLPHPNLSASPSYRDIGRALGVSRQRARQLTVSGDVTWHVEEGTLVVSRRHGRLPH